MTVSRNLETELDALKVQMKELQQLVRQLIAGSASQDARVATDEATQELFKNKDGEGELGGVFYSGQYCGEKGQFRWEPQERRVSQLLELDGDKVAKVLAALGHKQRLDILRSVLREPLTGTELVERLNMGTTGQLYHHIKALSGADLLVQEERGGSYSVPGHRALPLLLLLAAASDLLDTTDYMDMAEARNNAGSYLGQSKEEYDPHHLLWAVVENSILEHQAGYCSEVSLFLHDNGSITVADNGRGIPVQALPNTDTSQVQSVFTDMGRLSASASIIAPGGERGIGMSVVNALSLALSVEIRREGTVFRQDYKHGIPQTGVMTVGITKETGTSVTFLPDSDIFRSPFDYGVLTKRANEIAQAYPELAIRVFNGR
ncbi:ATP-binding protein [Paenibacillus profundus]|uniref:DNA topoisomerase (ATP-hydrolyzing) n=1 Tax=Paenibacillus profundus TaxID=1173085 RepID=A0ABS8YUW1_9BACL|nr:ATP-binding protein [Paenibacillus profundus]MCE5173409.1 ATP-binding protein [Paenibacillus profundus]